MTDQELERRLHALYRARSGADGAPPQLRADLAAIGQEAGGRFPGMFRSAPFAVAATALVAAVAIGLALFLGRAPDVGPTGSHTPSATAMESPSASLLPGKTMPGTRAGAEGEYGWTGAPGSRAGMHRVTVVGEEARMTQIVFAIENDCFASGEGPEPVAVSIAGLDGKYVEPYIGPNVLFMPEREEGQTTGGYALPIDDRTLCVYVTWDPGTTSDELDAARKVVDSIRGQAHGTGIRINFTLGPGWDTG